MEAQFSHLFVSGIFIGGQGVRYQRFAMEGSRSRVRDRDVMWNGFEMETKLKGSMGWLWEACWRFRGERGEGI
jgi:hypothetical protein